MGHAPPRAKPYGPPPSRESFHLAMARAAFLAGRYSLAYFDRVVEHVLRGGTLDSQGCLPVGADAGMDD